MNVVRALESHQDNLNYDPALKELIFTSKDETVGKIMSYNETLDYIQSQHDQDLIEWPFKCITSHECPFPRNRPNYDGSLFNVKISWENGEITSEPLSEIAADVSVTCTPIF